MRLFVNSWGKNPIKAEERQQRQKLLPFGDKRRLRENVKDSFSETAEIAVAESVSFQDFDLVVAAFGEAVGERSFEKNRQISPALMVAKPPLVWYDEINSMAKENEL